MSFLILFLVCWFLAVPSAADEGDDFSNNLFSDLAPLLALFGERVTMQFMSHSMGWADHIILSMGPLGILTVVVSAIRAGGPTWLKALVGRAMENLAAAEMDILSSTSGEVCELWNGEQVVRCMGSSPVTEFIVLRPDDKPTTAPKIVVMDLKDALDTHIKDITSSSSGDTKSTISSLKEIISRICSSQLWHRISRLRNHPNDIKAEEGSANNPPSSSTNIATPSASEAIQNGEANVSPSAPEKPTPEIIVIRNTSKHVPNISLNCHKGIRKRELWVFATIGSILQLGVVAYCGLATYYPTLRLLKGGKQVAGYAYPCNAIGTFVLVAGMMLCSHVVESRTHEKRYIPLNGMKATMVWLQQEKTVNDQSFGSYAGYADKGETPIITSERRKEDSDDVHADKEENPTITSEKQTSCCIPGFEITALESETIICTMVTICGFVIQFVGLRGMHWSASVTQLGIVLIMVVVKAWVRRGLASPPVFKKLVPGFELEWFSRILRDLDRFESLSHRPGMKDWTIDTLELSQLLQKRDANESNESQLDAAKSNSAEVKAHELMRVRLELGKLASYCDETSKQPTWHRPWSGEGESIAVAKSIEIVMNALFQGKKENFPWSIKSSDGQDVNFSVKCRSGQKWEADPDEIEAALSLWLFATRLNLIKDANIQSKRPPEVMVKDTGDYSWLEARRQSTKPSFSILGRYSQALHRDIWWWMPTKERRLLVLEKSNLDKTGGEDSETWPQEYEAIVGRGFDGFDATNSTETRFKARDLEEPQFDASDEHPDISDTSFLATVKDMPLGLLYAQDIFSAFMWRAKANLGVNPRHRKVILRPNASGDVNNWKSFVVTNEAISKMALEIQQTGLGSLEQIYQCLLPPLSASNILPEPEAIIDLARKEARVHEQRGQWKEAREIYTWLRGRTRTFDQDSLIATKATGVMMQFWRQVVFAIEAKEDGDGQLREIERSLKNDLTTNLLVFFEFKALYNFQNRGWEDDPNEDNQATRGGFPSQFQVTDAHKASRTHTFWEISGSTGSTDVVGWTPLHYAACKLVKDSSDMRETIKILASNSDINARDLLEWTPLHYASQGGQVSVVQALVYRGADVNAQGRDNFSPLHCAAFHNHPDTVRALIEAGAKVDIQDVFGNSPLLWAARKGCSDVCGYLNQIGNRQLRNFHGRSAFHQVAISKSHEAMERLLGDGKGLELEAKDRWGQTPLHLAAESGQEETVKLLLDRGAEIEVKDNEGRTPLHSAARSGQEAAIRLLLDRGAEIEVEDNNGWTPLHFAAKSGQEAAIRLLLERGAEIKVEDNYGWTPLHSAAESGQEAAIRLLHERGAEIEAEDNYSWTPLHCAAKSGQEAAVKLLLERGAEIEAEDNIGQTPLHYIAGRGHEATIRLLLERGAEIKAKDNIGQTPLHYAAEGGHEAAIRLLLERGAEIEVKDNIGQTPLHYAAEGGHEAAIRLLLERGAEIEVKDNDGQTSLHLAARGGQEAAIRLLLDRGAEIEVEDNIGWTPLRYAAGSGQEAAIRLLLEKGARPI